MQANNHRPSYNFSPSLIKDFINYVDEVGYEKDDEFIPFVTEEKLINRINKYPEPSNDGAKKGMDFENTIFNLEAKYGYEFNQDIVDKVRSYLPSHYQTQLWVEAELKELNTIVGGYCDVVGVGKIQDIKTGKYYTFPEYNNSPQLLYMLALKDDGINKMEFIITNFSEVFKEDYSLENFDFSTIFNYIERLQKFVNANTDKIVNLKVLGRDNEMPWLNDKQFEEMKRIASGMDEDKEFVKKQMCKFRMKTIYREALIQRLF